MMRCCKHTNQEQAECYIIELYTEAGNLCISAARVVLPYW